MLSGGQPLSNSQINQGANPVVLDDVTCVGGESALNLCSYNPFGRKICPAGGISGARCGQTLL